MSRYTQELITATEAARMLNVAPRTVARYREEGRLPYVRYSPRKILFRKADIESFINESYREKCDYCE
jgi:excisionase family DNA binding protein